MALTLDAIKGSRRKPKPDKKGKKGPRLRPWDKPPGPQESEPATKTDGSQTKLGQTRTPSGPGTNVESPNLGQTKTAAPGAVAETKPGQTRTAEGSSSASVSQGAIKQTRTAAAQTRTSDPTPPGISAGPDARAVTEAPSPAAALGSSVPVGAVTTKVGQTRTTEDRPLLSEGQTRTSEDETRTESAPPPGPYVAETPSPDPDASPKTKTRTNRTQTRTRGRADPGVSHTKLGQTRTGAANSARETRTAGTPNSDSTPLKLGQTPSETETKLPQTGTRARRRPQAVPPTRPPGSQTAPIEASKPGQTRTKATAKAEKRSVSTKLHAGNSDKNLVVLLSEPSRPSLGDPLSEFGPPLVPVSEPLVSVSDVPQTETTNSDKLGQLPTSDQQRLVLLHLYEAQRSTGLNCTPLLKAADIATALDVPLLGLRKQIQRLVKQGYIQKLEAKHGRGRAGSIYAVPDHLVPALESLKLGQQTRTNSDPQTRTLERSSSFKDSIQKTTTTDVRSWAAKLEEVVYQLDLHQLGIGSVHLLDGWKGGAFSEEAEPQTLFLTSVEHLAWYLHSPQSEGINKPKAWIVAKLKSGYFPAPDGFESAEEQALRARLKDQQAKLERVKLLQRESLLAEFEIWLAELSDSDRRLHLGDAPIDNPASPVARGILRSRFLQLRGLSEDFFSGE